MALNKYRLGDLIEVYKDKCGICDLDPMQVSGINRDKEFFEPSNQIGSDTSSYQMVYPGSFACNLMHVGRDCVLPIAYNHSDKVKHVSPAYIVFKLINNELVFDDYFMMIFKSNEHDRKLWFTTDSSVRDGMSLDDFKNVYIELPDLETQEKFVNVYKSMIKNQEQYERGLDDLKLTCDAYIKSIDKYHYKNLGEYISRNIDRNEKEIFSVENVKGFNNDGEFIEPMRLFSGNIKSFKILHNNMFVYNSRINSTITKLSIALNDGSDLLISPAYESFYISNNDLMPKFLLILLQQESFAKKVLFNSFGSSTIVFTFENLCEMKFPIPSVEVQNSIVNIHDAYKLRKKINEKLKEQIKNICPILIKGAIEEAREV